MIVWKQKLGYDLIAVDDADNKDNDSNIHTWQKIGWYNGDTWYQSHVPKTIYPNKQLLGHGRGQNPEMRAGIVHCLL